MDYLAQDGFYKWWKAKYFTNLSHELFRRAPKEQQFVIGEIVSIVDKIDSTVTVHLLSKFGMSFIREIEKDFYNYCAKLKE